MMKRILILLVLILTASSVSVVSVCAEDNEFPILEKQLEIRQAHLKWITAILDVSMEATVEYIDEISEGTGTSELSSLLDDFRDQTGKIETLTTHVALNNAIRQLGDILRDFRLETREQMKEHDGKDWMLLTRIVLALDENKEKLDNLEDEYWEIREKNSLEILDIYVDWAQDILDILEDNGYDTAEAQEKLDEIKDQRDDLEDALKDRDRIEILQIHLEIIDLSMELSQIVRDLQVEIPPKKIVEHWINVGDRMVERTDTIISELETLGIDVTELQKIHSKAEEDLERAQDEFDAGNLIGAIDALKDLKTDLIELRDAYEGLISEGALPEDMEAKVEAMIDTLDDTVEDMEDSI